MPKPGHIPDIGQLGMNRRDVIGTFNPYSARALGGPDDTQKKMESHLFKIVGAATTLVDNTAGTRQQHQWGRDLYLVTTTMAGIQVYEAFPSRESFVGYGQQGKTTTRACTTSAWARATTRSLTPW